MSLSSLGKFKTKAKLLQKSKKANQTEFALKDAYQILAVNAGYKSWKELKDALEISDLLNPPTWSAHWKVWYPKYDDARAELGEKKFLLPYREQFFVAEESYIRELGIAADDPDLSAVGRDWVNPEDPAAWKRILEKIRSHHKR